MKQVRHHYIDTGCTEDVGDPVPNRDEAKADSLASRLNNDGAHDRDLYYVTSTTHRTRHDFPRS